MNFAEALIDAKRGNEITREGVHWTLKLQEGKFYCKTTSKLLLIQDLDNHNIISTDWKVVNKKIDLLDLEIGDRFTARTISGEFIKTSQQDPNGVANYFVNLQTGQSHQVIGNLEVKLIGRSPNDSNRY